MATGNIPQTGGLNDFLAMLQNFSGTNAQTSRNTTGSQNTTGSTNTTQNLLSQIANQIQGNTSQQQTGSQQSSQTTSGSNTSTQTTRSDITQEGINRMLQTTLEADGGIASIFSGQAQAGGYGGTTSGMLASDLIARTAGELARLQAGTTVTTVGNNNQTVAGSQTSNQNTTGTSSQTQNQTTNQSNNTTQNQNQNVTNNQQVNESLQRDAPLDIRNVLGLLAGGTVLGPSLGVAAGGLGQLGAGLADLLRGVMGGPDATGDATLPQDASNPYNDPSRQQDIYGAPEAQVNWQDLLQGIDMSWLNEGNAVDFANWDLGF